MIYTMSRQGLTPTSFVVLGIVALRGPSTSYDLGRAVGHSIGYFWPFPRAQLYSEPKRLVGLGLLEVATEQAGRRRQSYTLTEAGRAALSEWLAQSTDEQMQVRDIAQMKLFFSEFARSEDLVALAETQLAQHHARIQAYEYMQDRFGNREDLAFRMIPLRLGMKIERAAFEFWQEFAEELGHASGTDSDIQPTPPAVTPSG